MKRRWFDCSFGTSEWARRVTAEASLCKDENGEDEDGENKNIKTMSRQRKGEHCGKSGENAGSKRVE